MSGLINIEEPKHIGAQKKACMQAFLELGFRPLYLFGAIWGLVGVGVWVFAPQLLQATLSGVFWHAHEMLWGFVGAIAIGFLLTATNNWTGINPLQGAALAGLTLTWLTARIGFLIPGSLPYFIASTCNLIFFAWPATAIARALWARKSHHNYALPLLLLGMGSAEAAFLYSIWHQSDYATLMHQLFTGLLCMLAITVLLARRVIPFFASRAIPSLKLNRHTRTGQWQTSLATIAILSWYLKLETAAALLFSMTGVITLYHCFAWKPWEVRKTPLLWILYAGYAGLGFGFLMAAAYATNLTAQLSLPIHSITVAGFGPLIIGMMTRTALGHTGRLLHTDKHITLAFTLLLIAVILRITTLSTNTSNIVWLQAGAACWILAFGIYLARFFSILTQPRIDQRPGKPIILK